MRLPCLPCACDLSDHECTIPNHVQGFQTLHTRCCVHPTASASVLGHVVGRTGTDENRGHPLNLTAETCRGIQSCATTCWSWVASGRAVETQHMSIGRNGLWWRGSS
eukprot:2326452-Karenia_brevis.AAC.1